MPFPARGLETPPSVSEPRPLTSWYTEGASDGVGDRLLMFDNSGTPSLELLRFRPELVASPGFEDALRQRVEELEQFSHPAFPQIRSIERLEDGSLALVSTFTAGKRLGEMFRSARTRNGIHPAFAAWLIRELTTSLADLQRQASGLAHGALTPDRIVLTDEGRLVITEHVLGAALDELKLPAARLWRDFSLIASEPLDGAVRLDSRNDVVQLAYVVLSVLLGRPIGPADSAEHAQKLIDEFVAGSAPRAPRLVPSLRAWLERALQVSAPAFGSAAEARDALPALRVLGGLHSLALKSPRPTTDSSDSLHVRRAMEQNTAPIPMLTETTASAVEEFVSESDPQAVARAARPGAIARPFVRGQHENAPERAETKVAAAPRGRKAVWIVAAVLGVIALSEAAVIARYAFARGATPSPAGVPIVLGSLEPGNTVVVDGRDVGVTPLAMTVNPTMRSIGIRMQPADSGSAPAPQPPIVDRPVETQTFSEAARERRGGLRLTTPIEVQVLEGEHVLGSSADGPIVTTAGRHELDFINSAIGYKSRQVVEIKAGQLLKMTVTPPDGRVSVNAVPWAQVSIDGKAIGETPFANLPLPAGEHQITFRHPQFGEQTQRIVVRSDALTRVSTTFQR
jgi:hypothetical protein